MMNPMDVSGEAAPALDSAQIRVAQYLHALPDVQVLQAQLHRVVQLTREQQARQALDALPDNKEQI